MNRIIQLYAGFKNKVAALLKKAVVLSAIWGVYAVLWLEYSGRRVKYAWLDRAHILHMIKVYLLAFLLIKTKKPKYDILWAGVTFSVVADGQRTFHTRTLTNPIRNFYETSEYLLSGAMHRYVTSFEPGACRVHLTVQTNDGLRISCIDTFGDREIYTDRPLPEDDGFPSVSLKTLPFKKI